MLGIGRRDNIWRWKAIGKHPAAADYINVNSGTPMMDAIAEWMTKGYTGLPAGRPPTNGPYSWRFWFRGAKKGTLVCGVGRDSSDRIGRPYPLLIVGEGPLKGWEKQWTTLPLVLTKIWTHIERMAAHRYADIHELGESLSQLMPPHIESDVSEAVGKAKADTIDPQTVERHLRTLREEGRVLVPLNDRDAAEPEMAAVHWQGDLGACCPEVPRAVFLGGNPQRSFLALIQQPLATTDFTTLWSV